MGQLCSQPENDRHTEVTSDGKPEPNLKEAPVATRDDDEEDDEEDDDDDDMEGFVEVDFERLGKGRQSVSAEATGTWDKSALEALTKIEKTPEQSARIRAAMKKSFAFDALNESETQRVVLALKEVHFKQGETVISQDALVGAADNGLYIVDAGQLKVFKKTKDVPDPGNHVHTYTKAGDTFGELALLYSCPRAATVVADGPCTLWALERNAFSGLVQGAMMARRDETNTLLASLDFLKGVNDGDKGKLADVIKYEDYAAGDEIVRQGEEGNKFYIVKSGKLEALVGGQSVKSYEAGTYFGELALLSGSSGVRKATVKVVSPATVMSVDRASFKRLLGTAEDLLKERASQYTTPQSK